MLGLAATGGQTLRAADCGFLEKVALPLFRQTAPPPSAGAYGFRYIRNREESFTVPAFSGTQCVDTTGAGDNFASGFICGLLEGKGLKECAQFANCTASVSVECVGATTGVQDRKQVEARYQEYLKMER